MLKMTLKAFGDAGSDNSVPAQANDSRAALDSATSNTVQPPVQKR